MPSGHALGQWLASKSFKTGGKGSNFSEYGRKKWEAKQKGKAVRQNVWREK